LFLAKNPTNVAVIKIQTPINEIKTMEKADCRSVNYDFEVCKPQV
jgi:hypothetical protein